MPVSTAAPYATTSPSRSVTRARQCADLVSDIGPDDVDVRDRAVLVVCRQDRANGRHVVESRPPDREVIGQYGSSTPWHAPAHAGRIDPSAVLRTATGEGVAGGRLGDGGGVTVGAGGTVGAGDGVTGGTGDGVILGVGDGVIRGVGDGVGRGVGDGVPAGDGAGVIAGATLAGAGSALDPAVAPGPADAAALAAGEAPFDDPGAAVPVAGAAEGDGAAGASTAITAKARTAAMISSSISDVPRPASSRIPQAGPLRLPGSRPIATAARSRRIPGSRQRDPPDQGRCRAGPAQAEHRASARSHGTSSHHKPRCGRAAPRTGPLSWGPPAAAQGRLPPVVGRQPLAVGHRPPVTVPPDPGRSAGLP